MMLFFMLLLENDALAFNKHTDTVHQLHKMLRLHRNTNICYIDIYFNCTISNIDVIRNHHDKHICIPYIY